MLVFTIPLYRVYAAQNTTTCRQFHTVYILTCAQQILVFIQYLCILIPVFFLAVSLAEEIHTPAEI